ncbi:MAG: hypothetical protein NTU73_05500 [Ignavibacteriae bacterium]|nr:hypothetical protein [Ignavibacteriota bacterium]
MIQHISIKKKKNNIVNKVALCFICVSFILFFSFQNLYSQDSIKKKSDTTLKSSGKRSSDTTQKNTLQIDTNKIVNQIDTNKKEPQRIDSLLTAPLKDSSMTNTKLFIHILLSVLGLSLFYFIFVQTLFKTFHKKRSSRQSMMLSWSLFLIVSILWIFIIWGIVANFWNSAAFMIVLVFLFLIGLIMTIVSVICV